MQLPPPPDGVAVATTTCQSTPGASGTCMPCHSLQVEFITGHHCGFEAAVQHTTYKISKPAQWMLQGGGGGGRALQPAGSGSEVRVALRVNGLLQRAAESLQTLF